MNVGNTAIFEKVDENRQKKFKEQVMKRALISEAQLLEFDVDNDGKIFCLKCWWKRRKLNNRRLMR